MTELEGEIVAMLTTLEGKLPEQPQALCAILEDRVAMLARSGVLYADAEHAYNLARRESYQLAPGGLSATELREYLTGSTIMAQRVLTLADRLQSTLSTSIKAIITLISFAKQELAESKFAI